MTKQKMQEKKRETEVSNVQEENKKQFNRKRKEQYRKKINDLTAI